MKNLKNFFLNKFLFLILFLFITTPVFPELKNNEKLNHITSKLRCMTCQNQTIYESETEFSKQIKTEILEQLNNNKNEEEIIEFIIQRYGEYVLLKPKFDKKNLVLWLFPFFLLLASMGVFYLKLRLFLDVRTIFMKMHFLKKF